MNSLRLLVITPVRHIVGVPDALAGIGEVTFMDDPTLDEVLAVISGYDALFTNPNKSRVFIGKELIDSAFNLKVICTASTGTNHIDKSYAREKGVEILSLTEERAVIDRISSTAELAFGLTLAGLRHVIPAYNAVMRGEWDYTRYVGRQMSCLSIGVVGYGRLGSMYARYCAAFGATVRVYDPYKMVKDTSLQQVDTLRELVYGADVVAIHVHVTEETAGMFNAETFKWFKSDVLLVNTSRGDVVNEPELVAFLKRSPQARVATDVVANEVRNRLASPLLKHATCSDQVIITPHIGGMTKEAQSIAYGHAAHLLAEFTRSIQHGQRD